LSISHETIYLRVWHDRCSGGDLWSHMRQADKRCRRRYRGRDSRGRLPGKRHICERPAKVETRATVGHWEIDTIEGDSQGTHSALPVVERTTGYLQMGKLERHCAAEATARTVGIIKRQPERSKTITADDGTESHSHKLVEDATGVESYIATPYHSWERGTNENTNGLIRQYLQKTHGHGACHPSRPGRDRSQAQRQAEKTAGLQDTGGMLCTIADVLSASVALQT